MNDRKVYYITIYKNGEPFKTLRSDSQEYFEYQLENRFKPIWGSNKKIENGFNIWDEEYQCSILDNEDIFSNKDDCLLKIEELKKTIRIGKSQVN